MEIGGIRIIGSCGEGGGDWPGEGVLWIWTKALPCAIVRANIYEFVLPRWGGGGGWSPTLPSQTRPHFGDGSCPHPLRCLYWVVKKSLELRFDRTYFQAPIFLPLLRKHWAAAKKTDSGLLDPLRKQNIEHRTKKRRPRLGMKSLRVIDTAARITRRLSGQPQKPAGTWMMGDGRREGSCYFVRLWSTQDFDGIASICTKHDHYHFDEIEAFSRGHHAHLVVIEYIHYKILSLHCLLCLFMLLLACLLNLLALLACLIACFARKLFRTTAQIHFLGSLSNKRWF